MGSETRQHWLVDVARKAKFSDVDSLDIPTTAPLPDAWEAVNRISRLGEGDLERAVATHYRLNAARLETHEARALKLVPESVARRFGVLPLRETDRNN